MAKKKEDGGTRRAKGTVPPKLDLGAAVELVTQFYERAGGTSTSDDLSAIMQNSPRSSAFQLKMGALRSFDLIVTEGDRILLSSLAENIVTPQEPDDRAMALKEAFLKVEPFANVYQKFVGKLLPQDEFLKNSFLEYDRVLADTWMRKFKASAHAAGLLMDRGDGKLQVRESGKAAPRSVTVRDDGLTDTVSVSENSPTVPGVPAKARPARTEYQMLIDVLAAEMTAEEQAAVWTLIQYLKKRDAATQDHTGGVNDYQNE